MAAFITAGPSYHTESSAHQRGLTAVEPANQLQIVKASLGHEAFADRPDQMQAAIARAVAHSDACERWMPETPLLPALPSSANQSVSIQERRLQQTGEDERQIDALLARNEELEDENR